VGEAIIDAAALYGPYRCAAFVTNTERDLTGFIIGFDAASYLTSGSQTSRRGYGTLHGDAYRACGCAASRTDMSEWG
jgi:hypothetical protein